MTNAAGPIPAGWYNDPGGSGHLRWWDGAAWSAHLAPQPTPAPAAAPVAPIAQAPHVQAPAPFAPVGQPPVAQPPVAQPPVAPEEQYVPFQGSWNSRPYNDPANDFVRPAQWNTVGGWLIAFSSIVVGILEAIITAVAIPSHDPNLTLGIIVGGVVVTYLLLFLFAEADRRALRRFGFEHTASILWMLLGPLVYLILRTVAIGREVRRGYAPLVTFGVIAVVGVIASVGLPLFLASRIGSIASDEFELEPRTGLDQNGGHYTVACPSSIPTTVGSEFTCTATDTSTRATHTLNIEVVTGADGKPTVKLLSVTPPISG